MTFRSLFEQAEKTSEFWRQAATLDFAEELSCLMAETGMTRAELARRLGTSPASITQALRADRNLTLETMTRLAMVFGHRVCVHLGPQKSATTWQGSPLSRRTLRLIAMAAGLVAPSQRGQSDHRPQPLDEPGCLQQTDDRRRTVREHRWQAAPQRPRADPTARQAKCRRPRRREGLRQAEGLETYRGRGCAEGATQGVESRSGSEKAVSAP